MILKLKQKLKLCADAAEHSSLVIPLKTDAKEQLLKHLEDMKKLLPDDLNIILNNT